MATLSDLIKKENCFITVDGVILKNIVDLKNYLSTCEEKNYSYHVNSSKNDFSLWVKNVLVSKDLADNLLLADTLAKALDVLNEFFKNFDYRSKNISDDKAFHTREMFNLKNIQELYYYINNSDDYDFYYHVTNEKNDFANWVNDVLLFPQLALKMRQIKTKNDMLILLKSFLLDDSNLSSEEYQRYISERTNTEKNNDTSKKDINKLQDAFNELSKDSELSQDSINTGSNHANSETNNSDNNVNNVNKVNNVNEINSSKDDEIKKSEETIDFSNKPNLEPKEDPEKVAPPEFDTSGFRQFTDEELEKFVVFAKKEETSTPNVKVDYLKSVLQELTTMIRDLRRIEKDPLVADLMLRGIKAKIDYYAISQNIDDYNHIIRLFKDVQHEIEECANQKSYNLADEIFNTLKIQAIALKKA